MSSNRLATILLIAGCNQVFGNHPVGSESNAIYDAPIDAPFVCSPIGVTPRFSPLLHQYQVADCTYYAQVGSDAIAVCSNITNIAPIGQPLVPAIGIATAIAAPLPRLAPDGTYMVVSLNPPGGATAARYLRDGDGWTLAASQPELAAELLGNIVHVAGADRILARFQLDPMIYELVFDGSAWTPVATHPPAELAAGYGVANIWWTADALRMVVADSTGTLYYTDRPTLDMPFRTLDALELAGSEYISLSDDCARIYLTGLGSIFYAQQL